MKFEVTWDPELIEFYIHGSTVEYSEEGVRFENRMLSPGAIIVQWRSNPNYQEKRGFMELPLLEQGKNYQIKVEAESFPKPYVLLKIEFYNRAEECIDMHLVVNRKGKITYPQGAYSYRILLLNNGIEKLNFRKIILQSYDEGGDALD